MFDSIAHDMRYAVRAVRRSPGFSLITVLTLALGAGANAAMFHLLDAVRLRTLPVRAPQELVEIRVDDMTHARGTWFREAALTHPLWEEIRRHQEPFSGVFAWADETIEVATTGELRKVHALWVSGDAFQVLGIRPALGRVLAASDDRRGCGPDAGVVLNDAYWRRELGGDPSVVGKLVSIGKIRTPVIGVTQPGFFGLEVGRTFDIALPICAEPAWHATSRLDSGTAWWLTVMGRLRPGVSMEQAGALLRQKSGPIFEATLPAGYPSASVTPYLAMKLVTIPAATGVSRLRAQYSQALVVLVGITALVLLIACVNLAHLALARATARMPEVALRLSLGASRRQVAQQLVVESLVLAIIGVALGLLLARTSSRFLVAFLATGNAAVFLDLSVNVRTFAFAAALSIVTCVVFASMPVWRAARTKPAGSLASSRPLVGSGHERPGVRRALLASQIALSLTLLAGTVLFARSLRNLRTLDAGFEQHGIAIADVNFSDLQLPSDRAVFVHREILERIRAIPEVDAAAEVLIVPLTGGNWNNRVWMDGSDAEHGRVVMRNMIGTEYFRTLRTALLAGREFADADMTPSSSKVAVVNERFARELGLDPRTVGRRFWIETTPLEPRALYEIVGVVANTKYRDLREDDQPIVYVPLWQAALRRPAGQFVIRFGGRADPVLSAVRATFDGMGPTRYSFRLFDAIVQDSLVRERLMATLALPFGVLAGILTALGLYGVFSYTVARRTHEIGIRMALGADRRTLIVWVLREAAVIVVAGLMVGALLALAAGRAASSLLFGLTPYDPPSLALAGVLLAFVATIASYLPARRAASVDPVIALRQE